MVCLKRGIHVTTRLSLNCVYLSTFLCENASRRYMYNSLQALPPPPPPIHPTGEANALLLVAAKTVATAGRNLGRLFENICDEYQPYLTIHCHQNMRRVSKGPRRNDTAEFYCRTTLKLPVVRVRFFVPVHKCMTSLFAKHLRYAEVILFQSHK